MPTQNIFRRNKKGIKMSSKLSLGFLKQSVWHSQGVKMFFDWPLSDALLHGAWINALKF